MKTPNHIGIIIDGTRRYARANNLSLREAYNLGAERVYETIRWVLVDFNIKELSFYTFSYDNLQRPSEEREAVLKVQEETFKKWIDDSFFNKEEIGVKFAGEYENIPSTMFMCCNDLEEKTKNNKKRQLNILLGYMGHREIGKAVRRMLEKEDEGMLKGLLKFGLHDSISILCDNIQENLDIFSPVDLIIRTANEHRISGFMPWQSEYAEFYFIDKPWPEIEKRDIENALEDYARRERRRGQ